ncbi:MAG: S41 family peptidase [Bacteroidales bacterium]|nr:S41 family peptidase [Bacteroidales bacterium]
MKYKNTKVAILVPMLIALSVVVGMFIARLVWTDSPSFVNSESKIDDVMKLIDMYYVDELSPDSIEDVMISDFLHNLDPHSSYMTAKETLEVESELTGNFVGIGIRFYVLHDTVLITNIIPGGASEKAGLMAGDKIINVDDKPISGIGISNDSVRGRILGEEGKKVKIGILRDGVAMNFEIRRAPVEVESVYYSKVGDIGYIKVTSFNGNTAQQFEDALNMLKIMKVNSLVIDLRDNSGGFMHAAQEILDNFFTDKQLLVYTEGANSRREEVYSSGRNGKFANYPLAVLVDENSASASEITAGVIQDYDKGTVIGNVTFGKGLVQRMFNLSDGSSLRLTVSRYYLPSGRCIQRSYKDGYISYLEQYYANYGRNKQTVDSSKVFYTLNQKRKVYEGDGLMPDITVEHDTSYVSNMLLAISRKNIIADFCVEYCDVNRKKMEQVDSKKKLDSFLENDGMFNKFLARLSHDSIQYSQADLTQSRKYLNKILRFQIAGYVLDYNIANAILLEDDPYMDKAIEILQK